MEHSRVLIQESRLGAGVGSTLLDPQRRINRVGARPARARGWNEHSSETEARGDLLARPVRADMGPHSISKPYLQVRPLPGGLPMDLETKLAVEWVAVERIYCSPANPRHNDVEERNFTESEEFVLIVV